MTGNSVLIERGAHLERALHRSLAMLKETTDALYGMAEGQVALLPHDQRSYSRDLDRIQRLQRILDSNRFLETAGQDSQ